MRRAARELAVAHGVPFRFIECRADTDVCRAREHERSVSDGRLEIFDSFRAHVEPVTELAADEHVVVDTTRPVAASMAGIRASVEVWPATIVK